MSLAGLKKQFNKANQYVSEKIGGAKGTELDDEFIEMEKKIDVFGRLVDDLIAKTHEFLQPNPASRAKMTTVNTISKIRGQQKVILYPQPEGTLGEYMIKHGRDLGDDNCFGQSLVEAGESFKHLAEIKYNLEDNVKQNFIEPLTQMQNKDLKEVNHYRKKLSGRRLDYDCKRRKKEKVDRVEGSNITDEELRVAEDKFEESKSAAETAMHNLLEAEEEQIAELQAFISAQCEYHRQAVDALTSLLGTLEEKRREASGKPRTEHVPKRVSSFRRSESPSSLQDVDASDFGGSSGSYTFNHAPPPSYKQAGFDDNFENFEPFYAVPNLGKQPCAKALYDFVPENDGELGFQEGDMINLISQVDENWFEGSVHGKVGYFPINYVDVIVPI
ncbi:endophilin-A2-like isoform X3 [Pomacea canaliculata]|uniref:endophilin-A2-like isoform X3 n=1 Tax=Pomacea canaliculata TaxID=400727 RepID=UPI000D73BF19|nr:endophilin-A2-like isoform X3 [Pomacea canaliculata]